MKFDISKLEWLRAPEKYTMEDGKITITTMPGTDLWQRTYYHFRNDTPRCCRWRQRRNSFPSW